MCWFLTSLQNLAQATNFCFTPIWQANGNLNGLRQAGAGVQPPVSLPALCDPIGPAPNLVYPTSCPSGTVTLAGLPEVSIGSTLIVFMQGFHCVCVARDRSIIPYWSSVSPHSFRFWHLMSVTWSQSLPLVYLNVVSWLHRMMQLSGTSPRVPHLNLSPLCLRLIFFRSFWYLEVHTISQCGSVSCSWPEFRDHHPNDNCINELFRRVQHVWHHCHAAVPPHDRIYSEPLDSSLAIVRRFDLAIVRLDLRKPSQQEGALCKQTWPRVHECREALNRLGTCATSVTRVCARWMGCLTVFCF